MNGRDDYRGIRKGRTVVSSHFDEDGYGWIGEVIREDSRGR